MTTRSEHDKAVRRWVNHYTQRRPEVVFMDRGRAMGLPVDAPAAHWLAYREWVRAYGKGKVGPLTERRDTDDGTAGDGPRLLR